MKTRLLLWTGGWDSTYRLLDLLHSTDDVVQPIYLFSIGRPSAAKEVQVIHQILQTLAERHGWGMRVRRPRLFLGDLYRSGPAYVLAHQNCLARSHLGKQYMYLACFRDEEMLDGLELGLIKGDGAYEFLKTWLEPLPEDPTNFKLNPSAPEDLKVLFAGYHFPLFLHTKVEMEIMAAEKGFADILEMSWFCHGPMNGEPCGTCSPCKSTIRNGLGRRVGEAGLARHAKMIKKEEVLP